MGLGKTVDHYFVVSSITGVISEIGAPNLRGKTHIDVDGVGYKIFTNDDQDLDLRTYYRSHRVQFKVKQKVSVDKKKVISASLLSYKIHEPFSLFDNLAKLTQDDLSIIT